MRLTTKGRYGVRATVNLASVSQDHPTSIRQISEEENLSPEFLEQIFFRLKKAGLIRSIRGPKGGFILNRKPSEISIKSILDAVGEPLYPAPCTEAGHRSCPRQPGCAIAPVWLEFYELIRNHLAGITLSDILDKNKNVRFAATTRPASGD